MKEEHFLVIGFTGLQRHIDFAVRNNYTLSLLIEKKKYRSEFEQYFAQVFQVEDIFDARQLSALLSDQPITAVFTRYEDYIKVVGVVNDMLSLDGISYSSAQNFGNKYLMKQAFLKSKVPCAQGICADKDDSVSGFIAKYPFPLVLKKTSGTHSNYVFKVKSQEDLEKALNKVRIDGDDYAIARSVEGVDSAEDVHECSLLLEEMLSGREVTVDTFISNGVLTHTPICEYVLPRDVDIDDSYLPIRFTPTKVSPETEVEIKKTVEKALIALGADNCVCHTELFIDEEKKKAWVIETTPRSGGNRSQMINYVTSDNYDKGVFLAAAGQDMPVYQANSKAIAVLEYFAESDGVLTSQNFDFIESYSQAEINRVRYTVGSEVKKCSHAGKSLVSVTVKGDSQEDIVATAIEIFKQLRQSITVE